MQNGPGMRNQSRGYFVPLGNNVPSKILSYSGNSGAGGAAYRGTFTTATWAAGGTAPSPYTSTISTTGAGVLRDCGQAVISAGRVFRKIQLLVPTVSTFGVGGAAPGTTPRIDYLTGYLEVHNAVNTDDFPGGTVPAQLAYYPTLY